MADSVTFLSWIERLQTVILAAGTLLAASILRAFKTGAWSTSLEARIVDVEHAIPKNLELRLTQIEQNLPPYLGPRLQNIDDRMDRAGKECSRLATEVQGMPERIRKDFVTRERFDDWVKDSKEDRTELWEAVRRRAGGRDTRS